MSLTRQYLVAGSLCFVSFLILYGLTSRGALQASDEVAVFASGVTLATHGTLAIDELQWLNEHVNIGQKGPDGHLYSKYFPGNVLGVALLYKLTARSNDQPYLQLGFGAPAPTELAPSATGARWALELDAVWGALGMTALLLLLRRYFDWRTAILTVVLVGFCSDWWYQSRGLFSEVGAGAFLIAGLFLAFNSLRFGSVLNFGYGEERFGGPLFQNLYGILLGPGRSPFVYSPIFLLAVPGAYLLFKRERLLTILCLIVVTGYLLTIARMFNWAGGVSWGSRYLTPTVPLIGVLLAPAVAYVWENRFVAVTALLLGIMGASVQVLAILRDPMRVMMEHVATGEIDYQETLYTAHNSWLALQIRSLPAWQPCDVDSYPLRHLFTNCTR